jgi:hypothetical protein
MRRAAVVERARRAKGSRNAFISSIGLFCTVVMRIRSLGGVYLLLRQAFTWLPFSVTPTSRTWTKKMVFVDQDRLREIGGYHIFMRAYPFFPNCKKLLLSNLSAHIAYTPSYNANDDFFLVASRLPEAPSAAAKNLGIPRKLYDFLAA